MPSYALAYETGVVERGQFSWLRIVRAGEQRRRLPLLEEVVVGGLYSIVENQLTGPGWPRNLGVEGGAR
jgi:hypothetical protein